MPKTYTPIATQTLTTATNTISFTSIPGTYTDLVLVCSIKADAGTPNARLLINNTTTPLASFTQLQGNGTAVASNRAAGNAGTGGYLYGTYYNPLVTGSFKTIIFNVMNYANTTTYKTVLIRTSGASDAVEAMVGLWQSTNAITQLNMSTGSNNFAPGSTLTLYGILKA
jgi:hypothetical protein